ncbi:MAG: hypothetical protein LBE13_18220 [Bacteroidales bacterium]|jgi:hypothetical protein|nr:hypothetical protein [Bacteroidales bacterium]
MYTTTVGRIFLNAYNKKFATEYTARTFFKEVFVPLFFDHPKYMMTAGNSPLENPKLSWDDMIKGKKPFETPEQRQKRINKMIYKVETEKADACIAVGYGVLDDSVATASQITNIEFPDNKEDIYLSWIGAGLGIGVTGGITILFDYVPLLLDIFDGWQYYREYLEKTPLMKGNQINTWNGNWIAHRYGRGFDETDPIYGMNPLEKTNEGLFYLPTIMWTKVLLGISLKHSMNKMLVGYLYNIGQTNTTIGFIPFQLKEIYRPNLFYERIFGMSDFLKNVKQIEELYGTALGLRAASQYGSIGVRAMEPKGLRAFFSTEKGVKKITFKENDEEQKITFNTYLIWILAMLNNEKLWDISRETAELLLKYEAGAKSTRTDRKNKVNKLLESASDKQFLLNMIPIIEDEQEKGPYENLGKMIHTMPKDNFSYFNTLIRFQYALLNK